MSDSLVLHQFFASHFNEKARWTLDYKHLPHDRVSYLPGPHMPSIKKLTGGSVSTTPVLAADDTITQGSSGIIAYLEQHYPEQPLIPANSDAALNWQSRLDEELGPAVRTVVFSALVEEPGHLAATFSGNKPLLKRAAYRAMLPLVLPVIKKANGVDSEENIKRCFDLTAKYLNEIAREVNDTGYLVGDSFTVADLSAAALLAPLAQVDYPDMRRPEPIPERLKTLTASYDNHPAIHWVRKMYTEHRAG